MSTIIAIDSIFYDYFIGKSSFLFWKLFINKSIFYVNHLDTFRDHTYIIKNSENGKKVLKKIRTKVWNRKTYVYDVDKWKISEY